MNGLPEIFSPVSAMSAVSTALTVKQVLTQPEVLQPDLF